MKTRSLLTIAFAVVLAGVGAVFLRSLSPPQSPTGSLAFLSAAPTLPIYDRAGKAVDLSKQKGRLVIIHFWATWCPPCVEEVPALSKFWEKYRGRDDVILYTVSVNKTWKEVDDFSKKSPNTLPIYLDPSASTAQRFGTTQYPETYIANKSGRVIYRVQGAIEWADPAVQQRIEQLLNS